MKLPGTLAVAFSWVALRGVPYWMAAGVGQLIVGTDCVTVTATPAEVLAARFTSPGNVAVSVCAPAGRLCAAVVSVASAEAELSSS